MGLFDFFRREREHHPDEHEARRQSATSSQFPAESCGLQPEVTRPQEPRIVHEVHGGETLWQIAQFYYGEGGRWRDIFQANDDILQDPQALDEGTVLRIPMVKANA